MVWFVGFLRTRCFEVCSRSCLGFLGWVLLGCFCLRFSMLAISLPCYHCGLVVELVVREREVVGAGARRLYLYERAERACCGVEVVESCDV